VDSGAGKAAGQLRGQAADTSVTTIRGRLPQNPKLCGERPDGLIRGRREIDIANVNRFRVELLEGRYCAWRDVLVEEELHAAGGEDIKRRSRSAANARTARMSSTLKSGKSSKI
jgi:hypothetical protein